MQFSMMQLDLLSLLLLSDLVIVMIYLDFQVLVSLVTGLDCSSVYKFLLRQYIRCSIISHFNQKFQQTQLTSWV